MKKLLVLLVAVVFASCSQDQVESTNPVAVTSLSVLDGKLLSFKDDKSFIKEYSALSELKSTKEIQGWILKKGHSSLFNTSDASEEMQDSVISNTRIIYSNALKAIVNADSKFKIGEKVLWLNERNFYVLTENDFDKKSPELTILKNNLEVYGKLLNYSDSKKNKSSSIASRSTLPNENRSKTYVVGLPNSKRYVLDLFNETIVVNDNIASSKMYLRYTLQYNSCSFWRCTWKTDTSTPWTVNGGPNTLTSTVIGSNDGYGPWTLSYLDSSVKYGQNTFLLATWGSRAPLLPQYVNFDISGSVFWKYNSSSIEYPQAISWY
ncbi:hypothetical protein [Flavobacterium sp. ZB4R12]|uniref:hypothetical protein n=1 Tax=Flavobacterium sp. ZB4R12 TaxID=3398732 RepID=UPI003AAE2DC8